MNKKESEKHQILSNIGVDVWLLRKTASLDNQVDQSLVEGEVSATALVFGDLAILVSSFSNENNLLIKDLFGSIVGYGAPLESYERLDFFWADNGISCADALQSFLSKIFINCRSPILLSESKFLRLSGVTNQEYLVEDISALADLSDNPDLKRELWQRIQKL